MAAENSNGSGSGGVVGWISKNLVSLLAGAVGVLASILFTDMRADIKEVAKLAVALDKKVEGHETRIVGVEKRMDRLEVNYMPWQRVPQRGSGLPEQPQELPPDTPRNGLVPSERRFQ
jgi:hypothetical protein